MGPFDTTTFDVQTLQVGAIQELRRNYKMETKRMNYLGLGIAIGVGVGVAIGSAMGNVGVGIAIGIAIGLAIGSFLQSQQRKKTEEQQLGERSEGRSISEQV